MYLFSSPLLAVDGKTNIALKNVLTLRYFYKNQHLKVVSHAIFPIKLKLFPHLLNSKNSGPFL